MFDWRRALVLTHRWLGVAGCVLFAAWFLSGIAMVYVRMPEVADAERLARAERLDLTAAAWSPLDAATRNGVRLGGLAVEMVAGRPAYRFAGRDAVTVFADTGEVFGGVDAGAATALAAAWAPAGAAVRYDAYLDRPDQWTLQTRLPVHRVAVDDAAGTVLYVSADTGDLVQRTTRRERAWAYLGPVTHWLYFTPLRADGLLWSRVVIWAALVGCVLCATGLLWGLLRVSPARRWRVGGAPSLSPYAGLMRWHHYAGLVFGLVTLTWVYSGLLSMEPFGWFASRGFTPAQREALAGGPLRTDLLTLDGLAAALASVEAVFPPARLEVTQVRGETWWVAERPPDSPAPWADMALGPRRPRPRLDRVWVPAADPARGARAVFTRGEMEALAAKVMAGVPVRDTAWLDAYDGYYYDAAGARPLPVLRVRYADEVGTWLYLDPSAGGVVQRLERTSRLRRWLYQGLHSLDFPGLYFARPAWDLVVVGLSAGGALVSVTTMLPAWRRLRAHAARLRPGRAG